MNENTDAVFGLTQTISDWRLGRDVELKSEGGQPFPDVSPISVGEILLCLKRIRKSVSRWSKRGGRQGYLYFIDNNIGR
jgi:hypothetical protein